MNLKGSTIGRLAHRTFLADSSGGIRRRFLLLLSLLIGAAAPNTGAATVEAAFTSANTVPLTAAQYSATGNDLNFSLGFAPPRGTTLTVVNQTGRRFIAGRFSNLAQGQKVQLRHGTTVYHFVADYYGGDGNDLVLHWAFRSAHAWGYNFRGQLGSGTTTLSRNPVAVTSSGVLVGKAPVSLAAGSFHSVVLCSDGTLAAWGENQSGQLGNLTTTSSTVPLAVANTGAIANKTVIAIAAGTDHTLALCSDGTVAAWGRNDRGQLGNGSTFPQTWPSAVNTSGSLAGKTVVAIAAGGNQSLALCSDGTLVAWGDNQYGQLGNGQNTQSHVPVTVQVGSLQGRSITSIGAGGDHSLAVTSDGRVAAWGSNRYGQLGIDYTISDPNVPVLLQGISGVTSATGGNYHSLALDNQSRAFAWGMNNSGQLGIGFTLGSQLPGPVSTATALSGKSVTRIAAGDSHSLALTSDGTLAAWGSSLFGQVGNNSTADQTFPVAINTFGSLSGKTPVAIAAGEMHSLAIAALDNTTLADDASLVTLTTNTGPWVTSFTSGHTNYSIIVPSTTASIAFTPRASNPSATVRVNDTVVAAGVASPAIPLAYGGNSISIVVTAANGTTTQTYQFLVTRTPPSTIATLSSLTLGSGALTPSFNSAIVTYGAELPPETTLITLTPILTDSKATLTVNGTPIASGTTSLPLPLGFDENFLVVRVTAEDGTTTRATTVRVVRQIPPAAQLTGLSANGFELSPAFHPGRKSYTIAVPSDTTGISLFPTVLEGSTLLFQEAPIPLTPGENLIAIRVTSPGGVSTDYEVRVIRPTDLDFTFTSAASVAIEVPAYHVTGLEARLALGFNPTDGTSLTVISNTGIAPISGRFANLAHGQLVTLSHGGMTYAFVADYFGGDGNDLMLHPADRKLFAWGGNTNGQLGNGTTTASTTPVEVFADGVLLGKFITAINTSGSHTVALAADGSLASWGQNSMSQLGTGNTTPSSTPVGVVPSPALAGSPVAISTGSSHTLALNHDGSFAAWGTNGSGQLGNGTTTHSSIALPVSTTGVLAGKSIAKFAASSLHNLVLCTDGTLVAWGNNSSGQLGNGTNTSSSLPVLVDTGGLLRGKTIVQIAVAGSHSLVLCSDGTLAAWGSNPSGQLGNGGTTHSNTPVLVDPSGALYGKTIVQIAAGSLQSFVVCSDGTVIGWGNNFSGGLGDNTKINHSIPFPIPATGGLEGKFVSSIISGASSTIAVCSDGSLVRWGTGFVPPEILDTTPIPADRAIVAVSSNGSHTVVAAAAAPPAAASDYALWLTGFPPLSDPSPAADPDFDDISNLMEFYLGGNPTSPSHTILPTATRTGGQITFTFHRRENAVSSLTQIFQFSSDLNHWQDIDLGDPTEARVTLGTTTPQGLRPVTVTLPATSSDTGNLFGRLRISSSTPVY